VFKYFWDSQGFAYETIPFDGRSDYDAFVDAGIPTGGIFAGAEDIKTADQVALYAGQAGVAFDRCYHQLCDDITSINDKGYKEHKDAAVHAILTFARTTSAVNGTDKGSTGSTKESDWRGDKLVR
jgi:Zn-dependent M28 family amino/carboxypeptidase